MSSSTLPPESFESGRLFQRAWVRWGLAFAAWTLVGVFFASQHYINIALLIDQKAAWWRSLVGTLPDWYLWGALTPLIFRVSERFPLERPRLGRRLALHAAAAACFALLHLTLSVTISMWLDPVPGHGSTWGEQFRMNFAFSFHWNVMIYALLAVLSHAMQYHRENRERARRAWQLEASLTQARLAALEQQLHPHFLFNTLSTVAELIHEQPEAAESVVVRLGELLRITLDARRGAETTLADELAFIEKYLEIERTRFADRLSVEWDIDRQALSAAVPRLVLQPLVENAIRHGISQVAGPGEILIRARRENGRLQLQVRDNGAGLSAGGDERGGMGLGLTNTRARLEQLYGAAQRLSLENGARRGLTVTLEIPYRAVGGGEAGGLSEGAREVAEAGSFGNGTEAGSIGNGLPGTANMNGTRQGSREVAEAVSFSHGTEAGNLGHDREAAGVGRAGGRVS